MATTIKIAVFYFLAIFIFAGVYWLAWTIERDSFIVHRELNLKPISALSDYLWKEESYENKLHEVFTFDELSKHLEPELKSIDNISQEFLEVKDRVTALNNELGVVISRLQDNMWDNVDNYKSEKMAEINKKISEKEQVASYLNDRSSSNISNSYNFVLANINVELAELRYEQAKLAAALSTEVLDDLVKFQSPDDIAEVSKIQGEIDALNTKVSELRGRLGDKRQFLYNELEKWIDRSTKRLNYWDFLYFSAGISATTTFGDIIPNSRAVRGVVTFQLLLCIFLVGVLISRASSPNKQLNKDARKTGAPVS